MYREKAAFFDAQVNAAWANQEYGLEESGKLDRLFRHTGPLTGKSVLEPGCGAGRLTAILSGQVGPTGRVTAMDISPGMVSAAQKRTNGLTNVQVHLAAVESFPLPENTYDLILCHQVFPHFNDKNKALQAMTPALKEAGELVVFHFINFNQINDYHRKAGTVVEKDLMPEESDMHLLFGQHGLKVQFIIDDEQGYFLSARLERH